MRHKRVNRRQLDSSALRRAGYQSQPRTNDSVCQLFSSANPSSNTMFCTLRQARASCPRGKQVQTTGSRGATRVHRDSAISASQYGQTQTHRAH